MKNSSPKNNPLKISVIGAGAWGSAISSVIAENGHIVNLLVHDKPLLEKINNKHVSPYLPKIKLSPKIIATDQIKDVISSDFLFIAIPSKAVLETIRDLQKNKLNSKAIIVLCSKGIDRKNLQLLSEIIEENLPNNFAILSGPNFAVEVAMKSPTTTSIASQKKEVAKKIVSLLKNDYFYPIASNDIVTAQIAGSVKNILAIGCGIISGLKLGENAKASLVLKGIEEINLLSSKLGGKKDSFFSPAGFGDLFLTCSSEKSRNNSLGIAIGEGANPKAILNDKDKTYEGAETAKIIILFAKKFKVKLPLCEAINNILFNNLPAKNIIQSIL